MTNPTKWQAAIEETGELICCDEPSYEAAKAKVNEWHKTHRVRRVVISEYEMSDVAFANSRAGI